jgi:uncharacterized protein YigA (DUF484 family)
VTITADQIAEYLQDHLDFFEQHPKLVRELKLPTDSGVAISLVEFQLRKLRDHIQQLERENDHMIETARINSVLFEKTRSLVLSLLDARNLDDLSVVLDEKLANGFDIPVVRLLLSDQFNVPDSLFLIQPVTAESLQKGGQFAQAVLDKEPWIGRLTKDHRVALFGDNASTIESSATLALVRGHTYGLLALGHPDPTHFQSNQDTLFLDHIGEALAMILPRLLDKAK